MSSEPQRFIEAVFIGFFVGTLSGGLGVGGGILATPLMRMLLAVDPHTAIGTSLAMIVPTAVSGALSYLRKGMVAVKLAVCLAAPAVLGTIAGSISTLFFQGGALMLLIALLLAATGVDLLFGFGKRLKEQTADDNGAAGHCTDYPWGKVVMVGVVCGYLSGLLGVGGGFLLVPALIYLFKSPIKAAFGTSLAVVAMVCIPGTLVHVVEGHVYHWLAFSLVLGSVPGAWLGSIVSMRLKDNWLRVSFGIFVIAVAAIFAFKEIMEMLAAGS